MPVQKRKETEKNGKNGKKTLFEEELENLMDFHERYIEAKKDPNFDKEKWIDNEADMSVKRTIDKAFRTQAERLASVPEYISRFKSESVPRFPGIRYAFVVGSLARERTYGQIAEDWDVNTVMEEDVLSIFTPYDVDIIVVYADKIDENHLKGTLPEIQMGDDGDFEYDILAMDMENFSTLVKGNFEYYKKMSAQELNNLSVSRNHRLQIATNSILFYENEKNDSYRPLHDEINGRLRATSERTGNPKSFDRYMQIWKGYMEALKRKLPEDYRRLAAEP